MSREETNRGLLSDNPHLQAVLLPFLKYIFLVLSLLLLGKFQQPEKDWQSEYQLVSSVVRFNLKDTFRMCYLG